MTLHRCLKSALVGIVASLFGGSAAQPAVVTVPATITFQVTDPSVATTGTPNPFVVSYVETLEASYVTILVNARTHLFAPEGTGAGAGDVSWTGSNAVGGSASSTTLTFEPQPVFIGLSHQSGGSVELVWTLAPLAPGSPPGTYTLMLDWGFELTNEDPPGGEG